MRRLMFTATALLLGCNTCLAQISTIGSTAMGIPSTPGAIVTSALNGPSPFSATTQPGAADTTLAPVPLASDPTTPGTVVTCSTPSGQIAPGTPAGPVNSGSAASGAPALGTLASSIVVGSTTGTIAPVSPLGSPSTTVCSSTPGGPPTNGAALPLSTPEIPSGPSPGTIQPAVAQLGVTSLDPTVAVVPTPNSASCRESVSMSLANPGVTAPANVTGATATLRVAPPSGC
jgi:hypothetical protein